MLCELFNIEELFSMYKMQSISKYSYNGGNETLYIEYTWSLLLKVAV